jgi:hypothetical protein
MSEPKRSRPKMEQYGISKKPKGLMEWQQVDEQRNKARNYWICSTSPDGAPHAAPVWGVWVDGTFYFSSGRTSRKARNLLANPKVVVHLESGDDVLIFEGVVEEVKDSALSARISPPYAKKYGMPDLKLESTSENICYVLKPTTAFSWLEKDFPNTATRWTFEE